MTRHRSTPKAVDPADWEELFDNAVKSNIGRAVTALVALALPWLGIFTAWVQDAIGLDLNTTDLAVLIATVVTGAAATAWQWLRNRGNFEKVVLELHKLYEAGKELVDREALAPGVPTEDAPTGRPVAMTAASTAASPLDPSATDPSAPAPGSQG